MKTLSIITINFNNKDGLEKTIQSVSEQLFKDFEYIVIDGGSTDGSVEVIKKYEKNINYWVSEKDKGIYNAQNKGIKAATGKYCLFLNSGDYLYNSDVLQQFFLHNYTQDVIYGDMMINNGASELIYGKQPEKITFEFLIKSTLWHPVSFIKRELFDKYGLYNEDLKIVADYEFFLNTIIVKGVSTIHVPLAVSVFNTFGIGSSQEHDQLHQAERKLVQGKYFNKELIDSANRFNALQQSKAVILSTELNRFPFVKKAALFCYSVLKKFKR